MEPINSKQRAQLRGMANTLEVVLTVGKDGISDNLVQQADDALEARELIKCKVLETSPLSAREACDELSALTRSEPVQVIGSRFVLYRHSHKLGEKCINLVQPKQKKTAGKKYEKAQ
ncbi:MAG: YhbY family RNA-binding protein [Clostridiales bacterium]|nr:YhbY family RNA-binding protein [Clostridiales bacterium]